jgi:hypothetical protein
VVASRGISAGEDFDNLTDAKLREATTTSARPELVTGQVDVRSKLDLEHRRPRLHPAVGSAAAHDRRGNARGRSRAGR